MNFQYKAWREMYPISYYKLGHENKMGFHTFIQALEEKIVPKKGQFKRGCGGKNRMVQEENRMVSLKRYQEDNLCQYTREKWHSKKLINGTCIPLYKGNDTMQ